MPFKFVEEELLLLDECLLTGAAFIWKAALVFIHVVEHRALVFLDVAAKGADIVAVFVLDIGACGGHGAGC